MWQRVHSEACRHASNPCSKTATLFPIFFEKSLTVQQPLYLSNAVTPNKTRNYKSSRYIQSYLFVVNGFSATRTIMTFRQEKNNSLICTSARNLQTCGLLEVREDSINARKWMSQPTKQFLWMGIYKTNRLKLPKRSTRSGRRWLVAWNRPPE